MPKALKMALKIIFGIVAALVIIVAGYIAYMQFSYYRIDDNVELGIDRNPSMGLQLNETYSAVTYNIGFGAYTPDYTFFMDEGVMPDGTHTWGVHSWAKSKESVIESTEGVISVVRDQKPDFMLFQEVDVESTRSHKVDQKALLESAFKDYGSVYAVNFHSSFLAFPFTEPHGIVNAGLLTLTDKHVDSAVRRSYPVDNAFITKFFDLDRCFAVLRIPVENGKQLVLINSHMSAYDEGGLIRALQLNLLCSTLRDEAEQGNYVVVGGDWNHALCGSVDIYPSVQLVAPWVATFDESVLPEGFSVVRPSNLEDVPTCRGDDIPYEKGVTYTTTVDGFIVSSNVEATAQNCNTEFEYSDHNPVLLSFKLKA